MMMRIEKKISVALLNATMMIFIKIRPCKNQFLNHIFSKYKVKKKYLNSLTTTTTVLQQLKQDASYVTLDHTTILK